MHRIFYIALVYALIVDADVQAQQAPAASASAITSRAAHRYGQRPERRDDERCERDVEFIVCVRCYGVFFRSGHGSSQRNNHDHGNVRHG